MSVSCRGIAGVVFASLVLAAPVAAQQAAQVALIEGDAPGNYRAAGAVVAEVQSASNTLPKQQLDDQLRAEAAKLGADAVIQVTYQVSPAGSGMSYKASGVAIRHAARGGAAAPAPVAPVAAAVAPPAPAVAVVAAAPAVPPVQVTHAASPAQVELSEGPMTARRFVRVGPVNVKAHQTSLMPKVAPRERLQEALKAEAFRMGADAVIEVKYDMVNAMFSRKGNTASGVAVKFE